MGMLGDGAVEMIEKAKREGRRPVRSISLLFRLDDGRACADANGQRGVGRLEGLRSCRNGEADYHTLQCFYSACGMLTVLN